MKAKHTGISNKFSLIYFNNAKKFLYYYNDRPQYYYANKKLKFTFGQDILLLIWCIISIITSILLITLTMPICLSPGKFDINSYDSEIVIEDRVNIITSDSEKELLLSSMQDIQDKTGVTICMVTAPDSNSVHDDNIMMAEMYCNANWSDRNHILIYNISNAGNTTDNVIIFGDDCNQVISSDSIRSISDEINNNTDMTIFDAMSCITRNYKPLKKNTIVFDNMSYMMVLFAFAIINGCIAIKDLRHINLKLTDEQIAMNNAIEIDPDIEYDKITCSVCNNIYLDQTCSECPYCHNKSTKSDIDKIEQI